MSKKPLIKTRSSQSSTILTSINSFSGATIFHSTNKSSRSIQIFQSLTNSSNLLSIPKLPTVNLPKQTPPSQSPQNSLTKLLNNQKKINHKSSRPIFSLQKPSPKPQILVNNKKPTNSKEFLIKSKHRPTRSFQQPKLELDFSGNSEKFTKTLVLLDPKIPFVPSRASSKQKSCVSAKFIQELQDSSEVSKISEFSSESDSEEVQQVTKAALKLIAREILESSTVNCIFAIALQAQNEVISAYLSLSSNKILFKLINEALDFCTPKIVQLAFDEQSEAEYAEIRDEVLDEVFSESLKNLVNDSNLVLVSLEIMKDYAKLLPIEEIVKESMKEEIRCENMIGEEICCGLVDLLVSGEWMELLIEDEIGFERIEETWKYFPPNLQKELQLGQGSGILYRIAESVWFGLLNEDISTKWLKSIIVQALSEEQES